MKFVRSAVITASAVGLMVATSGAAYAHECVNISKKNQSAGVQLVFDSNSGEIVWVSKGLTMRIDAGVIDFDTGEGFHGLVGFDLDGDGVADAATFIVGPDDEIPEVAQMRGAECRGVVNIEALFACPNSPIAG